MSRCASEQCLKEKHNGILTFERIAVKRKTNLALFRPILMENPFTWYHCVKCLQVFVGHAALVAHFINKPVDEPNYRVRNIRAFGILKAALCVVAFCHAASNTGQTGKKK